VRQDSSAIPRATENSCGQPPLFTLTAEPLESREGRYSWTISEAGVAPRISPESYATRREALAAGNKAMVKLVALSRVGK